MKRAKGARLAELMKATTWRPHMGGRNTKADILIGPICCGRVRRNGEIGLTSPLIVGWSRAAQLSSDAELVMGIAPAAIQRPPARIRKSGLEQLGILEKTPEN
jgi:hypothetical protein